MVKPDAPPYKNIKVELFNVNQEFSSGITPLWKSTLITKSRNIGWLIFDCEVDFKGTLMEYKLAGDNLKNFKLSTEQIQVVPLRKANKLDVYGLSLDMDVLKSKPTKVVVYA